MARWPAIQEFEFDGVTYTLDQKAGSDLAFEELEKGKLKHIRENAAKTLAELETSEEYTYLSKEMRLSLMNATQEEFIKGGSDVSMDDLYEFARTRKGMPYIFNVCCDQIKDVDEARSIVLRLDVIDLKKLWWLVMFASGMFHLKNLPALQSLNPEEGTKESLEKKSNTTGIPSTEASSKKVSKRKKSKG